MIAPVIVSGLVGFLVLIWFSTSSQLKASVNCAGVKVESQAPSSNTVVSVTVYTNRSGIKLAYLEQLYREGLNSAFASESMVLAWQ